MLVVRTLLVGFVVAVGSGEVASGADPQVALRLKDGQSFRGTLDPSSNGERLVLRTTAGGITLRRPIRWERIASAMLNGQDVRVEQLATAIPPPAIHTDRSRRIELRHVGPPATTAQANSTPYAPAFAPLTALTFYPYVANWDADVETDGLVLELMPVSGDGNLAPVSGTLEVELYAPHRRVALDLAPRSGGDTIELVERWTRAVSAAEFTASGLRLRLPFGAVHPEIDQEWAAWWYGIVHVKLSVPGQGVFEDSRDGVRIRPWAPTRDNLEMNTGQRFLPGEGMGRRN